MKQIKNKKKYAQIVIAAAIAVVAFSFATPVFASDITSDNVAYLINKERIYYGLSPLKIDPELSIASTQKSKDMIGRNYFEHFAYGLTPWDFIKNSGYNYLYAGENLAMNFDTSEGMVNAWMNSPAHRANILSPDFQDTGIGVVKGEFTEDGISHTTTMVTDMFGYRKPAIIQIFDKVIENISFMFGR